MPYTVQVTLAEGGPLSAESSVIMTEQWDDALPLRLPDRDGYAAYFDTIRDPQLTFEDRFQLRLPIRPKNRMDWCVGSNSADVIVISSPRNLWALPRNRSPIH